MKKRTPTTTTRAQQRQGEHDGVGDSALDQASHGALPPGRGQNQQPRQAVDDERDGEKDQPQFDERAEVKVAGGLGEFVGDDGRDGVAGRKRDLAICGVLPMTIVTAIVSPRARAKARNTEA